MKGKTRVEKGITLIALIITIVVLLILAVVAISSIQNDGILSYAENATKEYNQEVANEQDMLQQYVNYLNNQTSSSGNGSSGSEEETESGSGGNAETITIETDYVGNYVDLDNNGTPDGIIYIDKVKTESGSWNGYSYTITNVSTGLKNYEVVSEECTTDEFGTAKLLRAVVGSTGEERFYVMALTDVNPGTYYCWYGAAGNLGIINYSTVAPTGVEAGRTNTGTMVTAWNDETYGDKNYAAYADMWGVIEDGWYVPSKDEWAAFGDAFDITLSNYSSTYGLRKHYWSSSLCGTFKAWNVNFSSDNMGETNMFSNRYVRLGTTF